jgi:2-oxoglutarate dehydrogenase E1 component
VFPPFTTLPATSGDDKRQEAEQKLRIGKMARQEANEQFSATSFLDGANALYIEQLYARYQDNPGSVTSEWQAFFRTLEDSPADISKAAKGASWQKKNWPVPLNGDLVNALDGDWPVVEKAVTKKIEAKAAETSGKPADPEEIQRAARDSVRAIMMIRAYRMRGHLHAKLDPLEIAAPVEDYHELSPSNYGFGPEDMDRRIFIDNVLGLEYATVREMIDILERTYCSTLGVEFMHISDPEIKAWIQERIEGPDKGVEFTENGKKAILSKLIEAEGFEQFIDVKYKGTKRFGLDGSESLIPALEQIIKRGGQEGLQEVVLGMAHRGRLNVLTNVMHKPHRAVFHEFKGGSYAPDDVEGSGDVKYHLGASSDREFDGNKVHLSLTANPSHLEIVDPVVMGKARAKQDQLATQWDGDIIPLKERSKVLPLLLHGDAAFAGQGVISEILGLSGLRGHRVAGTMHFIINNQIGADLPRQRRRSGSRGVCGQDRHRISHEVLQARRHRHVLLPSLRPQRG